MPNGFDVAADDKGDSPRPLILQLARAIGDLVHTTQRERGGSSVFLASEALRFGNELVDLRRDTNTAIAAFLDTCDQPASHQLLASAEAEAATRMLARLAPIRSSIDRLDVSPREAIEYLTDLNEALLVLCGTLIEMVPNTPERARMLGLLALLRAKELLGVERAVLAQVFTEDRFRDGTYLWSVALISAQETLLRIAVGGNDPTFAAELARVNDSGPALATSAFETTAFVNGVSELAVDPGDWFTQVTSRIDLLKDLENELFERLDAPPLTAQSDATGDDHIMAEAISATVLAMRELRSQVDRVRKGELAFRDFMRGHGEALSAAEQQLATALQAGELTVRATRDELTGVLNRSTVPSLIEAALRRCDAETEQVAALMVDLDNFKVINDSLGHTVGDELLRSVAARLRRSVPSDAVVARVGGDEFLVISSTRGEAWEAQELAEFIIAHFAQPHRIDGRELVVNVSIGIGLARSGQPVERLLRDADLALHRAKKNGRNGAVVFDDDLRRDIERRHQVETGIRAAISDDSIQAHFQPIVEIATGDVVAAEALARWIRPERVITAAEFCPIADDAGLLPRVDEMVMRSAFAGRPQIGDTSPKISFNVSDLQLRQPLFAEQLREDMVAQEIHPQDLWIEVTEHYALSSDMAVDNLSRLRQMGCTIALDDFGSGYSALSVLRTLPLDVVKLDGHFIDGSTTDPTTVATLRSVIEIVHTLGLTSVAEGVESAAQLEVLADLGCEMVQGHYISRPAASAESWSIPPMPPIVIPAARQNNS